MNWWDMPTKVARFNEKFDKGDGDACWKWKASLDSYGYGQFWIDGRNRKAHQAALELHEKIHLPRGTFVLHACDNPPCVNPNHLRIGGNSENMQDKVDRGRQARGERNAAAKLTQVEVNEIRSQLNSSTPPLQRDLAKKYGVSVAAIGHIKTGFTWKPS